MHNSDKHARVIKASAVGNKKKKYNHAHERASTMNMSTFQMRTTVNITYDELFVRAYLLTRVVANDAFVRRR